MVRRAGIIQIDVVLMAKLLCLPEGHKIVGVAGKANPYIIDFIVEGPKMPVHVPMSEIPVVPYSITLGEPHGAFFELT